MQVQSLNALTGSLLQHLYTINTKHRTGPANILTDYPEFNRAFRQGLTFLEGHGTGPPKQINVNANLLLLSSSSASSCTATKSTGLVGENNESSLAVDLAMQVDNLIIKPNPEATLRLSDLELDSDISDLIENIVFVEYEDFDWCPTSLKGHRRQNSLLMYGPPGCGKTSIALSLALQRNWTFFKVSSGSVTSKWVGDAEK